MVQIGLQRFGNPDGSGCSLDKIDGYRRWGLDGVEVEARPLTRAELQWLVSLEDAANSELASTVSRSLAVTAVTNNRAFLALPAPTFPLNVAAQQALVNQVQALTRQMDVLIRFTVDQSLTDT